MANQASHQDKWEIRVKWLTKTWIVLIAILLISFVCFIPIVRGIWGVEHEVLAQYGEAYVIWHSFFDTLACFLIGLTVLMQYYDLRKREQQFQDQQFQNAFLPYLALFQTQIEHMECGPRKKGRQVLEEWSRILDTEGNIESAPEEKRLKFDDLMAQYGRSVEHYIRHLEVVMRLLLLEHLREDERAKYTVVVKSLLSGEERILLEAYCEFGPNRQLAELIKRFGFLSENAPLGASGK